MSETPRTDAVIAKYRGGSSRGLSIQLGDHARILERELAEVFRISMDCINGRISDVEALERLEPCATGKPRPAEPKREEVYADVYGASVGGTPRTDRARGEHPNRADMAWRFAGGMERELAEAHAVERASSEQRQSLDARCAELERENAALREVLREVVERPYDAEGRNLAALERARALLAGQPPSDVHGLPAPITLDTMVTLLVENDSAVSTLTLTGAEIRDLWRQSKGMAPLPTNVHGTAIECHGLDTPERVCFYEQDYYVLSNFSAFRLRWEGFSFDTSEAAYHWEKFPDHPGLQDAVRLALSAHEAFKIATSPQAKEYRRRDWDDVKVGIMRRILRAKADQHEYVRRKLLATGDRLLVENSWRDDFWGWGPNGDGKNMLGRLWMEVRAELRGQESARTNRGAPVDEQIDVDAEVLARFTSEAP